MDYETDTQTMTYRITDPVEVQPAPTLGDAQTRAALRTLGAQVQPAQPARRKLQPETWQHQDSHRPQPDPACPYCGHRGYDVQWSMFANLVAAVGRCERCGTRGWRWTE